MANFPPLSVDFTTYFNREFVYGSGLDTVQTNDITRALAEAGLQFNQGLWDCTTVLNPAGNGYTEGAIAYLYLAAFNLVKNVQAAGGLGPTNFGQAVLNQGSGGTIESASVGSVTVSKVVMDIARTDPGMAQYLENDYGRKYLNMLYPRLVGNIVLVSGYDSMANGDDTANTD